MLRVEIYIEEIVVNFIGKMVIIFIWYKKYFNNKKVILKLIFI